MYRITIDDELIYSPTMTESGYVVVSPFITQELNKADSLDFLLPDTNPNYSLIKPLKKKVRVWEDNKLIFDGRVVNSQRNLYRQKQVHCEGSLAYLNDAIIRPYSVSDMRLDHYILFIIGRYNEFVERSSPADFYGGVMDYKDDDNNDIEVNRASSVYPHALEELIQKVPKNLGGYVKTRFEIYNNAYRTYIDYHRSHPTGTQVIEFGKNLIDLDDFITAEDSYNTLIPLGHEIDPDTHERLTIKSVNDDLDYVRDYDPNHPNSTVNVGIIGASNVWDDITLARNLIKRGRAALKNGVKSEQTLTISAIDLHLLDVNEDSLEIGYEYNIVSKPHNIDTFVPLVRCRINLINPSQSTYSFGKTKKTLTGGK